MPIQALATEKARRLFSTAEVRFANLYSDTRDMLTWDRCSTADSTENWEGFYMADVFREFFGTSFVPNGKRVGSMEERMQIMEDHLDIDRLMSLYCLYNDGGWEGQGPSHMGPCADLFVENGIWDCGPIGRAEGRENIRAFFAGARAVPYVTHNVMNPLVDIDGDVAKANWHVISMAKFPNEMGTEDKEGHWVLGNYVANLRRTSEGWRFTQMFVALGRFLPQAGYSSLPVMSVHDPRTRTKQ
jgi:SnoaL-like domain